MNILKINNTDSLLRDYYQLDEASEKLVVVKRIYSGLPENEM